MSSSFLKKPYNHQFGVFYNFCCEKHDFFHQLRLELENRRKEKEKKVLFEHHENILGLTFASTRFFPKCAENTAEKKRAEMDRGEKKKEENRTKKKKMEECGIFSNTGIVWENEERYKIRKQNEKL